MCLQCVSAGRGLPSLGGLPQRQLDWFSRLQRALRYETKKSFCVWFVYNGDVRKTKQNKKTKQKTLPCRIFVPGGRQKASGFCGEMIWRQRYNSSAVTFRCQPSMHPLSVAASCAPLLEGKEGVVLEPVPADTGGDAGCILHSQLVTGLASVHTMIPSVWNKKPNYSLAVLTNYEINFKPILRLSLSSNRKSSQCWTIEHTIITWNRCLVPVQFLFFFVMWSVLCDQMLLCTSVNVLFFLVIIRCIIVLLLVTADVFCLC